MALVSIELETLVSEPDALTTNHGYIFTKTISEKKDKARSDKFHVNLILNNIYFACWLITDTLF